MKINLTVNMSGSALCLTYEDSQTITIGRDTENSIAPVEAAGLSRKHARIYFKDGAWFIEDLGSTNGTFVGGEKIGGALKLKIADKIQLGKFSMVVDGSWVEVAAPQPPVADAVPAPEQSAAAPAAIKPVVAKPISPISPVTPVKPASPATPAAAKAEDASVPERPPAESSAAKPSAAGATAPVTPKIGGIRPGLKLPAGKPIMKPGLKLPSAGLKPGLKLPSSGARPGLKPGLKLPPKPGAGFVLKRPVINKPAEG